MVFGVGLLIMAVLFFIKSFNEFQGNIPVEQRPSRGNAIGYLVAGMICVLLGGSLLAVSLIRLLN